MREQHEGSTEKSASPNQPQGLVLSRDASVRVLPADVYDKLEASAVAYGGIGAFLLTDAGEPYCMLGHAMRIDQDGGGKISTALYWANLTTFTNDGAVRRINARRPPWRRWFSSPHARVSFEEWCAELRVVRGKS